jgi:hypothetical protein
MHVEFMRSTEKQMPAVAEPLKVQSLTVWHCKFKTLAPLASFRNLTRLSIAGFPDESFEQIATLSNLRELSILHFPRVRSLSPLTHLVRLTALSLESLPSWDSSGKQLVVESLSPLAELPSLVHLQLFGVVPPERSLAALEASASLKSARFQGYPAAEAERFYLGKGVTNASYPFAAG